MTNGDKIRQMSNEELMENIISSGLRGCDFCIYICMSRECIDVRNGCKKGIKAYLDMEVEE